MAEAMILGLLKSKTVSADQIVASDVDSDRLDHLTNTYKISSNGDNQKAIDQASIVVLSIKPQNFNDVLKNLDLSKVELVISIAAGISLGFLEDKIPGKPIIRVMPNNPALVQKGISAIVAGQYAKNEDVELASMIFKSVGDIIEVPENLIDAVTGLSGSGPAFVYLVAEAMIEAGETLGLTKSVAEKLSIHTILGSAETLLKTNKPAGELREMVTSPGGTTKAGLEVLENRGFKQALIDAIIAAARRAKELSS